VCKRLNDELPNLFSLEKFTTDEAAAMLSERFMLSVSKTTLCLNDGYDGPGALLTTSITELGLNNRDSMELNE
jgi:hypothetical protein